MPVGRLRLTPAVLRRLLDLPMSCRIVSVYVQDAAIPPTPVGSGEVVEVEPTFDVQPETAESMAVVRFTGWTVHP